MTAFKHVRGLQLGFMIAVQFGEDFLADGWLVGCQFGKETFLVDFQIR